MGVVFFTLVRGSFPFEKASLDDKFFRLIAEQNWSLFWRVHEKHSRKTFSVAFKKLIMGMLTVDPLARLNMDGVAESEMISEGDEDSAATACIDNTSTTDEIEKDNENLSKFS